MITRFDELLAQLGTGWWDVLHYLVLIFCLSIPASHSLAGAFLAPNVDYTCIPSTTPRTSVRDANSSILHTASVFIRPNHSQSYQSECTYFVKYEEMDVHKEELCNQWHFDNSTFTSTVTSDFQLVCDKAYLRATYQSIYMSGMFIGALISGFSADKYGRKTTIIFGLTTYISLACASSWVPNFSALLFCRFMLGMIMPFISNTGYILVMEISEPRLRPYLGIMSMLPWAFGMMIWGGVAYLIRSWRLLQFAVSLPGILVLPLLWYMDESPRWLAVTGQSDRAIQVLKKAARWNRAILPPEEDILDILRESQNKEERLEHKLGGQNFKTLLKEKCKSILILTSTPQLRKITLCLYVAYLIVNLVYYGLSLSGGDLSDNPFVFMALSGLMEVPAYTLTVPIVTRLGRKMPTIASFVLSGVALLAIVPTPSTYGWLVMSFAMFGKLSITAAYQILIFYSTELFPTEVRSRGIGTCFMSSRIGSIVSPFIVELLGSVCPWAPSVVFGITSILACVAMMRLPETLGCALPDTIAQLEERASQANSKSWIPVPTSENAAVTSRKKNDFAKECI